MTRAAPTDWLVAIRLRQLGDVLSALAGLRALKAACPERRIAYVVDGHYHALLAGVDGIDRLVAAPPAASGPTGLVRYARYVAELRRLRPSVVIDFHGNARSALLTRLIGAPERVGYDVRLRKRAYTIVEPRALRRGGRSVPGTATTAAVTLARRAGAVGGDDALPAIPVEAGAEASAREALRRAGVPADAGEHAALVGLNPGRTYPAKAWQSERWAALARRLTASGKHVLVMWGPGEEADARAIATAGGRSVHVAPPARIEELPGLLCNLSLLVTIDSGLKHLAVCVRVPTLTVFGSTDPREWHMGTPADRYLWKGLSCSPCRRTRCPFGTPCMDFGVDEVAELAAPALAGERG
ncbi:MAG: glycosyltransferase family 9 protein [Candidatus Krumholzibacteria bacterium]|nr:glycosyltransferase family 9 protein [Candidatus Krumholzibacteria bacterium]